MRKLYVIFPRPPAYDPRLTSVQQAAAFFQKMVEDIDLDHRPTQNGDLELKGHVSRDQRKPLKPVFEPMRRKLDFPSRS